jgi:hypothetical protein
MQDSLPAGGLRLYREGVEPSGSLRKVSGYITILLSRICPVARVVYAEKVVALNCDAAGTPIRLQGHSEDVFDRHAELAGGLLRIGEMRVDEALLFRLNRVQRRRDGPNIGISGWPVPAAGRILASVPAAAAPSFVHSPPSGLPAGMRGSSAQLALSFCSSAA